MVPTIAGADVGNVMPAVERALVDHHAVEHVTRRVVCKRDTTGEEGMKGKLAITLQARPARQRHRINQSAG